MYGILEDGVVIGVFAAPLTIRSNQPVFSSDLLSLKRQIRKREAQRWEIQTNIEPLSRDANDLFVHIVSKGVTEEVKIRTPQNSGVISKRTSKSTPIATGVAGASSVTVINNTGLIPKGTFIKFNNHNKVYMTLSNLTGNGTLNLYPTLRANVTDVIFKHRDDVEMTCYYDLDTVVGMAYTDGILMDLGSIKLVEKL
jgi:hypothetical protein